MQDVQQPATAIRILDRWIRPSDALLAQQGRGTTPAAPAETPRQPRPYSAGNDQSTI
ncbi:MAG: hypothetical protein ACRC0L_07845 [Angustibacter sp.]